MKLLLVILGILSFPPLQQERSTPANEKDLKRQQQRVRAISLIEEVGSEAELWDDKRSAVEALATAADLLGIVTHRAPVGGYQKPGTLSIR